jgi:beta-phosphoglucomutase
MCKAFIFDLDGVVVDTARYHYLAWKRLADQFGYKFTEKDNEQFKGVNRMVCMKIFSDLIGKTFSQEELNKLADKKNEWYKEFISKIEKDEVLPGFVDFVSQIRKIGGRTALASASKNAALVLDRLELRSCFDAIVDGNDVQRSKPDPQVFQLAAERLDAKDYECIVFEDAQAGIIAAKSANMFAVGIGSPINPLAGADTMKPGFEGLNLEELLDQFNQVH